MTGPAQAGDAQALAPIDWGLEHLEVELAWLQALFRLRLRELQAAEVLPAPGERFPGTSVSPQEIEARMRAYGASQPTHRTPGEIDAVTQLAAAAERRATFQREATQASARLPLKIIESRLRLDPDEYMLFLVALAPEFDPSFTRLYAYLQNHFERQYATLALVAEVLVRGRPARVHRLLRAQGPLIGYGLLQVGSSSPGLSSMYAALTVDPKIVRLVQGQEQLDASLESYCRMLPARAPASMVVASAMQAPLDRLIDQFARLAEQPWDLPCIVLTAPEGSGKRHLAALLAHAMGREVLAIDFEALIETPDVAEATLRAALREAVLRGALACVVCGKALEIEVGPVAPDARPPLPTRRWIARAVRGYEGAIVLTSTGANLPVLELERVIETLRWGAVDEAHAARLWERLLPSRLRGEGAAPSELARRFELTPAQMLTVLQTAQSQLGGQRVSGEALHRQVRAQVVGRLGEAAHLVEADHGWDDLVVSDEVRIKLQELVNRYRYTHVVANDWGIARRFGGTLGLSVLFAGPSGTGKTMAASIVAKHLGLDLYQVDLSRIVSKWLGETEKALGKIFDEAERARGILLFDEADSLFSKRTSVESAHDRYANLEVNYLLQRVERFRGVAILTTNFPDSLDQAFKRRLSAQITFPAPDVAQRERLWRTMLDQPGLPIDRGIQFDRLASQFTLAGGLIRNAVLRAVFLAVPDQRPVTEELLVRAATAEMAEQGMLVRQPEGSRSR